MGIRFIEPVPNKQLAGTWGEVPAGNSKGHHQEIPNIVPISTSA
jgi:hypothetical protein